MKYPKLVDGEIFELDPKKDVLHFACCDCGMVHEWQFQVEDGKVYFQLYQIPAASAQLRRHEFGALHEGVGKWKMVRIHN